MENNFEFIPLTKSCCPESCTFSWLLTNANERFTSSCLHEHKKSHMSSICRLNSNTLIKLVVNKHNAIKLVVIQCFSCKPVYLCCLGACLPLVTLPHTLPPRHRDNIGSEGRRHQQQPQQHKTEEVKQPHYLDTLSFALKAGGETKEIG